MSSMGNKRWAAKRDENEPEIVEALERVGAYVQRLSEGGVADLLVHFRRVLYLLEVKARKAKLNPSQERFRMRFPVSVTRTPEDALRAIGAIK